MIKSGLELLEGIESSNYELFALVCPEHWPLTVPTTSSLIDKYKWPAAGSQPSAAGSQPRSDQAPTASPLISEKSPRTNIVGAPVVKLSAEDDARCAIVAHTLASYQKLVLGRRNVDDIISESRQIVLDNARYDSVMTNAGNVKAQTNKYCAGLGILGTVLAYALAELSLEVDRARVSRA